MYFKGASYSDVDAVCHEISQISGAELFANGVDDHWKVKLRAKKCKDDGFLKVGFIGDKPVCIFGGAKSEINTMKTWFIATEEYFNGSVTTIRDTIRQMQHEAKVWPHFGFESASKSDHPAMLKWFRTLGFSFIKVDENSGARIFRYVGRNSTNSKECATVTT